MVQDIDREGAYAAQERIASVTRYILEHFSQKTIKHKCNSILATASIDMAMMYYAEFKLIFLEAAIQDYNAMFNTNFDTSSDKFQNYYKDISHRMKNRQLDLLIVVNMFLTGFDATTLNTLWVDKNLKMHGLFQAFSRTNRILDSVKTFGNIVCFRHLQERVDEAVVAFGDTGNISIMRKFEDYHNGYISSDRKQVQGYADMIKELTARFPLSGLQIIGEQNQKEFIGLFGAVLRMRNIMAAFDQFSGREILSEHDMQDYKSHYLDIRDEWRIRRENGEVSDIIDDVVFELELVNQIEINIDYILLITF